MSIVYMLRRATELEEPITIVCRHDQEYVESNDGLGKRCRKCGCFWAKDWYSPQVIMADDPAADAINAMVTG